MARDSYDDPVPWYNTLLGAMAFFAALAVMQHWPRTVAWLILLVPVMPLTLWVVLYANLQQAAVSCLFIALYVAIVRNIVRVWFR